MNMKDVAKEASILAFDAFEGDFGMPGDKTFSNKLVLVRKVGPCAHCNQTLKVGERVRSQQSKFDGELMSHRWCALCCDAMAAYDEQSGNEDRESLPDYELRSSLLKERQP